MSFIQSNSGKISTALKSLSLLSFSIIALSGCVLVVDSDHDDEITFSKGQSSAQENQHGNHHERHLENQNTASSVSVGFDYLLEDFSSAELNVVSNIELVHGNISNVYIESSEIDADKFDVAVINGKLHVTCNDECDASKVFLRIETPNIDGMTVKQNRELVAKN